MKTRAQVPLLIIAIAIGLLIYVYFLPLSEKCKIMSLPECVTLGDKIFSTSPGIIEEKEDTVEYSLLPVELFTKEEKELKTIAEGITVKKGWFYSYSPKLAFSTHEKSKGVMLFIYLGENKAINIIVNGKKVTTLKGAGQHVVFLPANDLKDVNILEIYPNVPWFPWQINTVLLQKVLYKESYLITQEKISQNLTIKEDLKNILEAKIIFKSECLSKDNLTVIFNDEELNDELICGTYTFDILDLIKDKNILILFSQGNYFVYNIVIELKVKEVVWPTYHFTVPSKPVRDTLKLELPGDGEKRLTVYLNGNPISVVTSANSWQTDITKYISAGSNVVIVIPEEKVEVGLIEIY